MTIAVFAESEPGACHHDAVLHFRRPRAGIIADDALLASRIQLVPDKFCFAVLAGEGLENIGVDLGRAFLVKVKIGYTDECPARRRWL